MFDTDINQTVNFSDTEKFNQNLIEIRSIVTELEFKREELNSTIDSLTRTMNSFALFKAQL